MVNFQPDWIQVKKKTPVDETLKMKKKLTKRNLQHRTTASSI